MLNCKVVQRVSVLRKMFFCIDATFFVSIAFWDQYARRIGLHDRYR